MIESRAVVASRVHSKGMKHINTLNCSFNPSISAGAQFLAIYTAMTVLKSNVLTEALKRAYAPDITHYIFCNLKIDTIIDFRYILPVFSVEFLPG